MAIKVLLDTDPGSDIDDAVCIGYLLSNPDCDLLGITTVTGEPEKRAMIASAVCHAYGREDVPIYPGAAAPLLIDSHQPYAPHARVLPRWPHRKDFESGEAVNFLRRTIREHPGEVELLTIGALTNIALLFTIDPEIPSLLRGVTIMGGRFVGGVPVHPPVEHNIRCDPHAAARVFNERGLAHLRVVGLDVTYIATQHKEDIRKSFCIPQFKPILEMAEEWFQVAEHLCYHDIVAAATIFEPALFGYKKGKVWVETCTDLRGYTYFDDGAEHVHMVASEIDREGFLDHFCQVTGCKRV
ncbi:MAG TPA: nucleoside hydrolase [Fimbriimonas sp.]